MNSVFNLQGQPRDLLRADSIAPSRRAFARDTRPVICHVLHTLHVGGGEVLARAFALENKDEFRPVFAVLDDLGGLGRELRDAGHTVKVIGRRAGFDLLCALRLGRFFREQRVSLIHAHQYGPLCYSALARLPSARLPILFTEHGRDFPDYRRWKRVLANRLLLGRRDRFVAVGRFVRQALIEYEGLPADRVEVIYNGSDLSAYDPRRPLRAAVRAELGLDSSALVVMQVARLNRLKDHPTAICAMELLRATTPGATLVIVGDGEERPALERLINALGLADAVRLLGTRPDVPRLLQAADVFLLTSISEGIPLTLIEAMATGLPCVATSVGGVPEVIANGRTGLLLRAADPADVATKLKTLLADGNLRRTMGQAGLARGYRQFSDVQMHAAYQACYREMTGSSRSPRQASLARSTA